MAQYFVTEYYVKTATTVSNNVDPRSISPQLAVSSDMVIKKILKGCDGSNSFYNSLLASYVAQTLTPDEIELVGYIRPALAWRVAYNTTSSLFAQITNKGPQTQNGDNSAAPDNSGLYYLLNTLQRDAEFYQQELVEYLRHNKGLYTGYTGSYCDLDNQYDAGIGIYEDGCRCGRNLGYCSCSRYGGYYGFNNW